MQIKQKIKSIIHAHTNDIAKRIVEEQYKQRPEVWQKYGEQGKSISIRDAAYHLPFFTEAIVAGDKQIFTDYVVWTRQLFQNLNLPENTMKEFLEKSRIVIAEYLDKEMQDVANEYIDAGIKACYAPLDEHKTFITDDNPYSSLVRAYNESLLRGDRHTAGKMIMDAIQSGIKIEDIYIHVFQISQYEIGRLWLANKVSVAKEHFATAATQQIMSQLYPYIFSTKRLGKSMVAATVGGDLHEIGIRMIADFFEMEGWDTYYLGANTPASSIVQAIFENKADLVAISVAMPYHRSVLKEVIEQIRMDVGENKVKIMIGGNAVKNDYQDWKWFGADDYAADAQSAVKQAAKLVGT